MSCWPYHATMSSTASCLRRFGERKTSGQSTRQWLHHRDALEFSLTKASKGLLRSTSLTKKRRNDERLPPASPADTTPKKQELQKVWFKA